MATETLNVYQKLNKVRVAIHSAKLNKSGNNTYANYKYFELGDFLPTAIRLFDKVGLISVDNFTATDATLTIIDCEKPESTIVFSTPVAEANLKGCHPVQNLGAQQTYIRRYLYTMALEIVEHDALDATTGKDKGNDTPKVSSFKHDAAIVKTFTDATTMEELSTAWNGVPVGLRKEYAAIKDEAKERINGEMGQ